MPWGKSLIDYKETLAERKRTTSNDQWAKLMEALGMAKSIWETTSGREEAKKAADLGYQREQELATTGFNRDRTVLGMQQAAQEKRDQLQRELEDARRQNDTAREAAILKQQQAFEKEQNALDRASEEKRAGLSQSKDNVARQDELRTAVLDYVAKLPTMRPDFVTMDANGQPVLDLSRKDEIRKAVLSAFSNTTPGEQAFITQLLDDTWGENAGVAQLADGEVAKPFDQQALRTALDAATALAQKVQQPKSSARIPGTAINKEHIDLEGNLEQAVDELALSDVVKADPTIAGEINKLKAEIEPKAVLEPSRLKEILSRLGQIYNALYQKMGQSGGVAGGQNPAKTSEEFYTYR